MELSVTSGFLQFHTIDTDELSHFEFSGKSKHFVLFITKRSDI